MIHTSVYDFQGFEDWPPEEVIGKLLDIVADHGTPNSRKFVIIGISAILNLVDSMMKREGDINVARDRIRGWLEAARKIYAESL